MPETVEYTREPFLIVRREAAQRKEVYGSVDDAVVLQAQLLRSARPSDTVLIAMHPMGSAAYLPVFAQLARSGHHVIACGTRYWSGDASLIMENVLLDLGACVHDARTRLGYAKVVLVGWSGGGSLMAGYQAEAQAPRITQTAAGDPTPLAKTRLTPADAVILIASHRSRHQLLTGQLDPSVTEEATGRRDAAHFHLYDPANPAQPPYSAEFLAEFRAAQLARNRRITAWVKERLDALRASGREHEEHCFTVHGTMSDPRWLDPLIEPNDRVAGQTYMGAPAIVNDSPAGLARFSSLRSWLSQWSFDDARVDSADAAPRITVPTLIVTAGGDDACPTSHPAAVLTALRTDDKREHVVAGANHYFSGRNGKRHLAEAMAVIGDWMGVRGFAN